MWVWGCVGLLAVRAIELLQICSQLLQAQATTQTWCKWLQTPSVWRSSVSIAHLDYLELHCWLIFWQFLTYSGPSKFCFSRIWKLSSKPDRASQENVKGGRPKCHVSSFETPPNSGAIRTIWIWDIVAQTYVLRLQSLHSFWRPLALHHSLAAWSTMAQLTESYPGHEPISTT